MHGTRQKIPWAELPDARAHRGRIVLVADLDRSLVTYDETGGEEIIIV